MDGKISKAADGDTKSKIKSNTAATKINSYLKEQVGGSNNVGFILQGQQNFLYG